MKTKQRHANENYTTINVPYKQSRLSKSENMIIIKQDKRREVVIKDKPKYNEKCLLCLDTEILEKLNYDSIKKENWRKNTKNLVKIRNWLSNQEYLSLYPSRSCPRKFYETVKVNKLSENSSVDDLLTRPFFSNFGSGTYDLAKHLTKLNTLICKKKIKQLLKLCTKTAQNVNFYM